jgi:hypothetical protein
MTTAEVIELLSVGPNSLLVAAVASEANWAVAEDWGLGRDWTAVRVPVGLKFRRLENGLVAEEVVVTAGPLCNRTKHQRLLARSLVPTHLVFVDPPQDPGKFPAPHALFPHVGADG